MRIVLDTLEMSDDARRAIRERLGRPGLATREEVRRWASGILNGELDTLLADWGS